MENSSEKKTLIIYLFILFLIIIITGVAYKYRKELNLRQTAIDVKNRLFTSHRIGIKFDVTTDIGKECLKIEFYIPCANIKVRQKLAERIPKIKHELLMTLSLPENIRAIKSRDFGEIKANCLNIINQYGPERVEKIYLESFVLN